MAWRFDPDPKEGFPWTWEKVAIFVLCGLFWAAIGLFLWWAL